MPQCQYYNICGRDSDGGTETDLCILHSENPDKNKQAFYEALKEHQSKRGNDFSYFVFPRGINFRRVTFHNEALFHGAKFLGRVSFTAKQGQNGLTVPIFFNTAVDFRAVILDPLDGFILRDADLQQCEFLDTDLRKAEITGATWLKIGKRGRVGVYDETSSEKGELCPWSRLERLYRELKQNYEDRHDYERAGDFHYGEKEARKRREKV